LPSGSIGADHGLDASLGQIVKDFVAVITLISEEPIGIGIVKPHQRLIAFDLRLAAFTSKASGLPLAFVRRWILVEKPPRERPSACFS
jgi:hypothetical protein